MQVYTIRIERRRIRRQAIAATSAETARRHAALLLREGDRILGVTTAPSGVEPEASLDEAREALDFLLSRPFLDLDGRAALLRHWILFAVARPDVAAQPLAMAGLRLRPEGLEANARLAIGSPGSVPALGEWFEGSRWAGARLLNVLDAIPGAARTNLTLAGIASRAVLVPLKEMPL